MENVEGLLDDGQITVLTDALETLATKYRVLSPFMVNAAHFGAATNRHRVVVIGYDPKEIDPLIVPMFQPKPSTHSATVRQAISDLPTPIAESKDEEASFGWAKYPSGDPANLSKYARRLRMPPVSGLGWKTAIEMHKDGYISGLTSTRHSFAVASRYASIPGGKSDPITKSYRLIWDGQCPTLRAGTGRDKGAFQAVRPLHPGNGRVITVREAARLQVFPDWFVFHPTKWHSFRMIGNSVSPAVSHGILGAIAAKMQTSALVK
jgi:DNA (cytosine-5)-methyltransferase 1